MTTKPDALPAFVANFSQAQGDAYNDWCEMVGALAGITFDDAADLFALYRRHKALRFDFTNRSFTVKHGALLDREVLRGNLAKIRGA